MDKIKKNQIVDDILQKLQKSSSLCFNYRGINVMNVEAIRKALRESQGEMKVVKNTLAHIGAKRPTFPLMKVY